jgi:tRNA synthetases class II (D, K and N)
MPHDHRSTALRSGVSAAALLSSSLAVWPWQRRGCTLYEPAVRSHDPRASKFLCLSQDLRSDRQPEFTQLDMEMAFMDQAAIVQLTERLIAAVFREVGRSHT